MVVGGDAVMGSSVFVADVCAGDDEDGLSDTTLLDAAAEGEMIDDPDDSALLNRP